MLEQWLDPLVAIVLAAVFCAVIGLDRELRGKAAGLRTNMVVGMAAAAFAYLSMHGFEDGVGFADPGRIAAQVVSGIGFLGGGAIFASGNKPHGLTTAAALWGSAAVGLCVGAGQLPLALALVAVTAAVLWPFEHVVTRLLRHGAKPHAMVAVVDDVAGLTAVQSAMAAHGFQSRDLELATLDGLLQATVTAYGPSDGVESLAETLRSIDSVVYATVGHDAGENSPER
jgi:putative Mg2+ transporter-C (MgtC) family protein